MRAAVLPCTEIIGPRLSNPSGKRAPFGLQVFSLPGAGEGAVVVRWADAASRRGPFLLRIITGIDDRELRMISVRSAGGRHLGHLDLRYAHALQCFELELPGDVSGGELAEGLRLESTMGREPLWLVHPEEWNRMEGISLHVVGAGLPENRVDALISHLVSAGCIHAWGWLEGCLLDAFESLHAVYPQHGFNAALKRHLSLFFTGDGRLLSEDARGRPCDDMIDTIESTLMFAFLAPVAPAHAWIQGVLDYWSTQTKPDGCVYDGDFVSAEGSYTIAYPMARIASLRKDKALAKAARYQIEARADCLWHEETVWLRWYPADGSRTFSSWARGLGWHLLGAVRTAEELEGLVPCRSIMMEIQKLSRLVLRFQRTDGLWACFADDPRGLPDTSGSAGIATALAVAGKRGWISEGPALDAARRCWNALLPHVRIDGRLGGVAQANRGGESLQRSDYRVLSAMGAGLAGQLHAALVQAER